MSTRITNAKQTTYEGKDYMEEQAQEEAMRQGEGCTQLRRSCARRWTLHKGMGRVQ